MAVFKVKAATPEGRLVFKDVEAASRDELKQRLDKEGLCALSISDKDGGLLNLSLLGARAGLKSRDMLVFNQGLVSLLKSGLPVITCLETLAQRSPNRNFTSVLGEVMDDVRSGKPLSEAMEGRPGVFPTLYTASIKAGERTGDLVPSVSGYIEYQKRMEAIRRKVVSAVTYPVVLTLASFVVVAFLISFVVPTFSRIYTDAGAELPLASQVLISTSVFVKEYFLLLLGGLITVVVGLRAYFGTEAGRFRLDAMKLSFPQFGDIYLGYGVAKFSRTLAMILNSGVNLIHALEMSKGVMNNSVLEEKLGRVIKRTREGEPLTIAMADAGILPEITLTMFGVGEKSANLPEILTEISDFHDAEVDYRVGMLTNLIEPALMVIMGLVIGTIVILLYLPIFQLGATV